MRRRARPVVYRPTNPRSVYRRSLVVTVVLAGFWAALIVRLVNVQICAANGLEARATQQHVRRETISARPGDILDVRGDLLATSIKSHSLFIDPKMVDEDKRDELADSLAMALQLDATTLREKLAMNADRRFLWVKRRLDEDEVRP